MWGAIISAALAAAGSIAGAVSKNKQINSKSKQIDKRLKENENWYNRRYNEDATQRADAQRMLNITEEAIKRRNKAAAGKAAVMGGTEESIAAEKEANNQAYANAVGQIAAASERRKDAIEQQYLNRKSSLEDAQIDLESQRANGLDIASGVIGGAASAIGNTASEIDEYLDGFSNKGKDPAIKYEKNPKADYTVRRERR